MGFKGFRNKPCLKLQISKHQPGIKTNRKEAERKQLVCGEVGGDGLGCSFPFFSEESLQFFLYLIFLKHETKTGKSLPEYNHSKRDFLGGRGLPAGPPAALLLSLESIHQNDLYQISWGGCQPPED